MTPFPNLLKQLLMSPSIGSFQQALTQRRDLVFEELWDSPKAVLLAIAFYTLQKNILVITGGSSEEKLLNNLPFFGLKEVLELPFEESLPEEVALPSPDLVGKRIQILHALTTTTTPKLVFAPVQATLQKYPPPSVLRSSCIVLRIKERFPFDNTEQYLTSLGYQRKPQVEDKGDFALRCGIIDIYPISAFAPIRIELFGDTIDTLRSFDPISQKSTGSIDSFFLSPATENSSLFSEHTLVDYLGEDALIIFDDMVKIEDHVISSTTTSPEKFLPWQQLFSLFARNQKLYFFQELIETTFEKKEYTRPKGRNFYSGKDPFHLVNFEIANTPISAEKIVHSFHKIADIFSCVDNESASSSEEIVQSIFLHRKNIQSLHLITEKEAEKEKCKQFFTDYCKELPETTIYEEGYLSSGFVVEDLFIVFFPMTELTHHHKTRRQKWRVSHHATHSEFHPITVGDLVVHFHQGIGRYVGMEKRENHVKQLTEFLVIEYAEGGKLFVPIQQAYLVSRYIGATDEMPTLHTIGGKSWQHAKAKAEKAIVGYATDLLRLQAERVLQGGFAYPKDGIEMRLFEENFAYEATDDQLQAIREVKNDMETATAMDRLICGDVGYGKTEVAMRAAFKAVADGKKQVAVLVPTTVLALQHYESFKERMAMFSIKIACVSRFQKRKEIEEILEKTAIGDIDILVGTHRILSKDVSFDRLGLIIIDEEQRFGVRAKEHLKTLKKGVDTLTLSATPIPRTLYMSLIGARTISIISTPPYDRLPIKTLITEKDPAIIRNALLRELMRDGQAFFIHNRVESIFRVKEELSTLLPQAKIVVAHGQMDPEEIDHVFHSFKSGEADVLVSTTIIENGIDIPNANTILIDKAEQFGLSDLYQMRGRVGRWNRPAYAYLLTTKQRPLNDLQRKRLFAISESSGYGGGLRLAMRDLELRGSGDILGTQQSGHVATVGFHLYCKLLKKAVDALQKQQPINFLETKIEYTFDARIPDEYILEPSLRMEIYHRFGEAKTADDLHNLIEELNDRFGPPPPPIFWLKALMRIKMAASDQKILSLKFDKHRLTVEQQTKENAPPARFTLFIPPCKKPSDLENTVLPLLIKKRLS